MISQIINHIWIEKNTLCNTLEGEDKLLMQIVDHKVLTKNLYNLTRTLLDNILLKTFVRVSPVCYRLCLNAFQSEYPEKIILLLHMK